MAPPRLAIITNNTLEAAGLKSILDDIIPVADVSLFEDADVFIEEHHQTPFYHFFVSTDILLEHIDFFLDHSRQTIVLSSRAQSSPFLSKFHFVNTSQRQHDIVKSLLQLHQMGHGDHRHPSYLPSEPTIDISKREADVLRLVALGCINKEIADKLCISLPTVVSHRKNICDKLHLKSVSSLTIYAVMHGLVSIEEI